MKILALNITENYVFEKGRFQEHVLYLQLFFAIIICSFFIPAHPHAKCKVLPSNRLIRYTGRIDRSTPDAYRFDWPCISIELYFEGTSCSVQMQGAGESFNVFVDGNFIKVLKTDTTPFKIYDLISDLNDSVHRLLLTKRFEHKNAVSVLNGFYIDSAKSLKPAPDILPYRIEFLGASSLNGFGNESATLTCDSVKLSESSNCYNSYGPLTARILGAECVVVAPTGKGLVRNWGSPFISDMETFTQYYSRTLQNDPGLVWNHYEWVPDVVVISLGINDFSTRPTPPRELFINSYWSFIQNVYQRYPDVEVICLTPDKEPVKSIINAFVENERQTGNKQIHYVSYGPIPFQERGCDWHPNTNAHRKIALKLSSVIKPILYKRRE